MLVLFIHLLVLIFVLFILFRGDQNSKNVWLVLIKGIKLNPERLVGWLVVPGLTAL